MPIDYIVAERFNPARPREPRKYYAQQKSKDEVTSREISNVISKQSTVSSIDIAGVLESLVKVMPEFLADGRIIRLGDFGSFYITIRSSGSDTKEDFKENMIREVSVKFRPGKEIKNALKNVTFNRISLI